MGVQAKYADLMYRIPKDEIRWITQEQFERDFEGVVPELKEWVAVRGKKLAADLEVLGGSAKLTASQRGFIESERKKLTDPIGQQVEAATEWRMMHGSKSLEVIPLIRQTRIVQA
jgi:hypothetical protein